MNGTDLEALRRMRDDARGMKLQLEQMCSEAGHGTAHELLVELESLARMLEQGIHLTVGTLTSALAKQLSTWPGKGDL